MKKSLYPVALIISLTLFSQCNGEKECIPNTKTDSRAGENITLTKSIAVILALTES